MFPFCPSNAWWWRRCSRQYCYCSFSVVFRCIVFNVQLHRESGMCRYYAQHVHRTGKHIGHLKPHSQRTYTHKTHTLTNYVAYYIYYIGGTGNWDLLRKWTNVTRKWIKKKPANSNLVTISGLNSWRKHKMKSRKSKINSYYLILLMMYLISFGS